MSAGAIKLFDNLLYGNLVTQSQRDQTAGGCPHGGLILQVNPVVKGELGKDLHRCLIFTEANYDIDGIAVGVFQAVTLCAENIGQFFFMEKPLAGNSGCFFLIRAARIEYLGITGAVPIDCQPLTAQFKTEHVG